MENKKTENKKGEFLKEFFKEHKRIGSIRPSSKSLAKKMLKNIDFKTVEIIVEFGPGTGVFTKFIAEAMSPKAKFYIFELHQPFYEILKEKYKDNPSVFVINDSAVKVAEYLKNENNQTEFADAIVSSLPLTNFENILTMRILKSAEMILKPKGQFIQYQYTLNAKKILTKIFDIKSIQFTAINLPPAFIYTCLKKNKPSI